MTCCIVAALIISQILAYRDRIKRLLGFRIDDDAGLEPLLPPGVAQRLRRAAIPVLALTAGAAMGFEHRAHLAHWIMPAAHAAHTRAAPVPANEICSSTPQQRQ